MLFCHLANAQQAEYNGLLRYSIPSHWTKSQTGRRTEYLATSLDGTYARLSVYDVTVSTGNPDKDAEDDWKTMVAAALGITENPKRQSSDMGNGWKVTLFNAPFLFQGQTQQALHLAFSNGKTSTNMVMLYSSDNFRPEIDGIIGSIRLEDQVSGVNQPTATNTPTDNRIIGKWQRSSSISPDYADASTWGNSGYVTSRYEFRKDGTYAFTERIWRATMTDILLLQEQGKFTATANTITVIPAESIIRSYEKKNGADELGALKQTKSRALETTTYNYNFHYFEGIALWNLVLQAPQTTRRDGPFSNNKTFQNAWYFDQRFTDKDLTSPRGK